MDSFVFWKRKRIMDQILNGKYQVPIQGNLQYVGFLKLNSFNKKKWWWGYAFNLLQNIEIWRSLKKINKCWKINILTATFYYWGDKKTKCLTPFGKKNKQSHSQWRMKKQFNDLKEDENQHCFTSDLWLQFSFWSVGMYTTSIAVRHTHTQSLSEVTLKKIVCLAAINESYFAWFH